MRNERLSGEVIQKCGEAGQHRHTLNYCTNQLGSAFNPKISAASERLLSRGDKGEDENYDFKRDEPSEGLGPEND